MFLGAFISVTAVLFDTGQARRKIGVRILKCLVEAAGIEPASENIFTGLSPSAFIFQIPLDGKKNNKLAKW